MHAKARLALTMLRLLAGTRVKRDVIRDFYFWERVDKPASYLKGDAKEKLARKLAEMCSKRIP
jgi:hypothetical protein